jgi:ABC-type lipoprotein export system ATPase subunit
VLLNLHREGRTILLVTHEREIADQTSRQLYLRDGRVERDTGGVGAALPF